MKKFLFTVSCMLFFTILPRFEWSAQPQKEKDGIYAFQMTELTGDPTVKSAKLIFQGKPVVLDKVYYVRTENVKFKLQWIENKVKYEEEFNLELFKDGSITYLKINIDGEKN